VQAPRMTGSILRFFKRNHKGSWHVGVLDA
jgi:hypothetical protein